MKSLTNKEAVDFAGCGDNAKTEQYPAPLSKGQKPPLFLEAVDANVEPEELRKQLSNRISDYSQQHNCKPLIICVRDEGILYPDPVLFIFINLVLHDRNDSHDRNDGNENSNPDHPVCKF